MAKLNLIFPQKKNTDANTKTKFQIGKNPKYNTCNTFERHNQENFLHIS